MKEPTEAQIKEFWEWCGWKKLSGLSYSGCELWLNPCEQFDLGEPVCFDNGEPMYRLPKADTEMCLPPIDLNSLFAYAVPKLAEFYSWINIDHVHKPIRYIVTISNGFLGKVYKYSGNDPALALFWAIYSVIKEVKK
jgi:hypothetical protein